MWHTKNMRMLLLSLLIVMFGAIGFTIITKFLAQTTENSSLTTDQSSAQEDMEIVNSAETDPFINSISIEGLRQIDYSDTQMSIERELNPGSNYQRYIARFEVEGLEQFGLLTIPNGEPPQDGWPAIVFNHGYIDPDVYRTTERYVTYQDGFARNQYVTFKADYRGHGNSEGEARGSYSNAGYTIDVLHAFADVQNLESVNSDKIGMWGHSMGGWITHRAMVIEPAIQVGVIWAGVVGSYPDLLELWEPWWVRNNRPEPTPEPGEQPQRRWREYLVEEYGTPQENPEVWAQISATNYLEDFSGPLQIHHGTADSSVPYELAESFAADLEGANQEVELFIYQGDDHNLSTNFSTAMQRSIAFFDAVLKE